MGSQCVAKNGYVFGYRTGGSGIKKNYKGHSPDPPTLVVKWPKMGTCLVMTKIMGTVGNTLVTHCDHTCLVM